MALTSNSAHYLVTWPDGYASYMPAKEEVEPGSLLRCMNCPVIVAAQVSNVYGDLDSQIPEIPNSPNYCIKRLFENQSGWVDIPNLFGVFDLQGPLVQFVAVGLADLCGKLHRLFERQFFEQQR